MKDLEKIKSEDLGCQVADANPGNFAIEQEVAQLVGATVPAPTEPSADDARELGAQLLVFLRRALLPIRSALRTAVAAIYAHLDSRCTDYPCAAYDPFRLPAGPYDPMRPFVPRTLPNLLQAITAFSARKISNGSATADGIPDGTSLARLLGSADREAVTELVDDTSGWDGQYRNYLSIFPNIENITLGFKTLVFPDNVYPGVMFTAPMKRINMPNVEHISMKYGGGGGSGVFYNLPEGSEIIAPNCKKIESYTGGYPVLMHSMQGLVRIVLGKLEAFSMFANSTNAISLIDLEIGAGTAINLDFSKWNPTNVLADADKTATFLQNFKEHIALRLTSNGSGKTLTLSQAVFDTIWNQDGTPKSTDPDSVIYQINKIIKTDKHWSVNRA